MKILVRLLLAATPWVAILLARADYPIVSRHYAAGPAPVEYNNRLYVYVSNDGENGTNESTTPVHHYNFNEVGGPNVADSIGGAPWAGTLPNGGVLGGGQLALASASSQYAKLPSGIVSTLTNFTIALWVNLNSVANWTRIFDFGNNTTTYMFLTPQNGINGVVRFAITTTSSGGEQQISGTSALTAGAWEVITSPVPRVVGNKWEISLPLDGNRVSTYYQLIK